MKIYEGFKEKGKRNPELKNMIAELYEKMQGGVSITSHVISNIYDLDHARVNYVMSCLKKQKHVLKRRDGHKIVLYIQNEV